MLLARWSVAALVCSFVSGTPAARAQAVPVQDPGAVVARFVDAYNAHDLEAVLAIYSDSLQGFALGDATPVVSGKPAIRGYLATLMCPGSAVHLESLHRTVQGPFVIEEARGTGFRSDGTARSDATIFEVADGHIVRFWMLAKAVPRPTSLDE